MSLYVPAALQQIQILFTEVNQILLKITFIPILLTFMYIVALYQKTEL